MPLDIFNSEEQPNRQVHPMLAQLMQQIMQQPQRQVQQGGPPAMMPLSFAHVNPLAQPGQQQPGLLNQTASGLAGLMPLAKEMNKGGGLSGLFGGLFGGGGAQLGGESMGTSMPSFLTDIMGSGGGEAAGFIGDEAGSLASMLSFI